MRTEVDPDGVFANIAQRTQCECPFHVPAQHQRDPAKAPGQLRYYNEKGTDTVEAMRLRDARKSVAPKAEEGVPEPAVDTATTK